MALDSLQVPPYYLAPHNGMTDVLVDHHRVIIMDPTDMTMVGIEGDFGAAGHVGRLVYALRTPSSRGF